jgi:hypothetical protein
MKKILHICGRWAADHINCISSVFPRVLLGVCIVRSVGPEYAVPGATLAATATLREQSTVTWAVGLSVGCRALESRLASPKGVVGMEYIDRQGVTY